MPCQRWPDQVQLARRRKYPDGWVPLCQEMPDRPCITSRMSSPAVQTSHPQNPVGSFREEGIGRQLTLNPTWDPFLPRLAPGFLMLLSTLCAQEQKGADKPREVTCKQGATGGEGSGLGLLAGGADVTFLLLSVSVRPPPPPPHVSTGWCYRNSYLLPQEFPPSQKDASAV